MAVFRVTHCVCFDVSFAELREVALARQIHTVEELAAVRPFGQKCGLCRPYVAEMLSSGRTEFTELLGAGVTREL